jgi:hypothetical protein
MRAGRPPHSTSSSRFCIRASVGIHFGQRRRPRRQQFARDHTRVACCCNAVHTAFAGIPLVPCCSTPGLSGPACEDMPLVYSFVAKGDAMPAVLAEHSDYRWVAGRSCCWERSWGADRAQRPPCERSAARDSAAHASPRHACSGNMNLVALECLQKLQTTNETKMTIACDRCVCVCVCAPAAAPHAPTTTCLLKGVCNSPRQAHIQFLEDGWLHVLGGGG